jgi:hypothetical protein
LIIFILDSHEFCQAIPLKIEIFVSLSAVILEFACETTKCSFSPPKKWFVIMKFDQHHDIAHAQSLRTKKTKGAQTKAFTFF